MIYDIKAKIPVREGIPVVYDLDTGWRASKRAPAPGNERLTREILDYIETLRAETDLAAVRASAETPSAYAPFAALPALLALEKSGIISDLDIEAIYEDGEEELASAGLLQY